MATITPEAAGLVTCCACKEDVTPEAAFDSPTAGIVCVECVERIVADAVRTPGPKLTAELEAAMLRVDKVAPLMQMAGELVSLTPRRLVETLDPDVFRAAIAAALMDAVKVLGYPVDEAALAHAQKEGLARAWERAGGSRSKDPESVKPCSNCLLILGPSVKFCPQCGTSVEAETCEFCERLLDLGNHGDGVCVAPVKAPGHCGGDICLSSKGKTCSCNCAECRAADGMD